MQEYEAAKHLLEVTYPAIKDPKLLLGVLNNIYATLQKMNIKNKLFYEVKELIEFQKKCPVEFRKNDAFVLCGKNYEIKQVTVNDLKKYLEETRELLQKHNGTYGHSERF